MKFNLLIMMTSLFLLACSSTEQTPEYESGFLNDYVNFKVNPNDDNSFYKKHSNFSVSDFKNYKKIVIAPIEIWLPKTKSDAAHTLIISDKSKQKALTDYFQKQLKRHITHDIEFVPVDTPGSLTLAIALTNIQEEEQSITLRDLIPMPIRIAKTVTENTYLLAAAKKAVIGSASMEIKFIDTNTKHTLISAIVERETDEMYVDDNTHNLDSLKSVINIWVKRLSGTINSGKYSV